MIKLKYIAFFFMILSPLSFADIAEVNGEKIEQRFVDFIKDEVKKQGRSVTDEMEENIIDRLIDLKVINQAAKKSGLLDEPEILTQAQLSTQELIYTLYLQRYIIAHPVNSDDLKSEYAIFKEKFNAQEFKARHILLTTKKDAANIITQLDQGDNFSDLAKEFSKDESTKSNGGDLGWFEQRDMLEVIYQEVAKLKKNNYTNKPIQTQFGWHIIKLEDIRQAPLPSFEEKESELKTALQKAKLKQHLDELRNLAKVKFK